MIPGALIQEETVVQAANAQSHAATRARYHTWLDPRDVMLGDFLKRTSLLAIASPHRGEVGGGN